MRWNSENESLFFGWGALKPQFIKTLSVLRDQVNPHKSKI